MRASKYAKLQVVGHSLTDDAPSDAMFALLLTSSRICTPRLSMPQLPTAELGPVTGSSKKAAYSMGYGLIFSVSRALDTARLILNLFCFQ